MTVCARSIEERRIRRKKKNAKSLFFSSRVVYVNCASLYVLGTTIDSRHTSVARKLTQREFS